MTDGERARLTDAFKTLQVAVAKVRDGCVEQQVFVAACAALGWVLDELVYRDHFETILMNLRERGVVLRPSNMPEGK